MKRLILIAGLATFGPGCILEEYLSFDSVTPRAELKDNREIDQVATPRRAGESEARWRQRATEEENVYDATHGRRSGQVHLDGPGAELSF